jgi:hypothetical protein
VGDRDDGAREEAKKEAIQKGRGSQKRRRKSGKRKGKANKYRER